MTEPRDRHIRFGELLIDQKFEMGSEWFVKSSEAEATTLVPNDMYGERKGKVIKPLRGTFVKALVHD